MAITVQELGPVVVLGFSGKYDIQLRSPVNNILEEKFIENKKYFVCDLSRVDFVDSSGLGIMISMVKKINTHKGRLVLARPIPSVRELLALSHLDQIFDVYPDVAKACESFGHKTT